MAGTILTSSPHYFSVLQLNHACLMKNWLATLRSQTKDPPITLPVWKNKLCKTVSPNRSWWSQQWIRGIIHVTLGFGKYIYESEVSFKRKTGVDFFALTGCERGNCIAKKERKKNGIRKWSRAQREKKDSLSTGIPWILVLARLFSYDISVFFERAVSYFLYVDW